MKKLMMYRVLVLTTSFLSILSAHGGAIPIQNHSFEIPALDPNDFPAVPVAPYWIELDLDPLYSSNTGVFRNQPPDSPAGDHIVNVDGNQLAFLNSATGNGFLQDLPAVFLPGFSYRLRADVCPSTRYPPQTEEPMDLLTLGFYFRANPADPNDPNDFIASAVAATEITINLLKTFSLVLPVVQPEDPWAGKPIGISIRAVGTAGAYWDVDNVRLTEFSPVPEFTDDSFVNLEDLAVMASEWMSCSAPAADVTGDACVDVDDLVILSESWLQHG